MKATSSSTPHPHFKHFTFYSVVWKWLGKDGNDKGSWYFLTVPEDVTKKIDASISHKPRKGFGSVPILVTIGRTRWRTSIFPDSKSKAYILPVKKEVRKTENIVEGIKIEVSIELVGVVV